jgi:Xaa-Pro aminopeptidase
MLDGGSLGLALDVMQAAGYTRIAATIETIEDIATEIRSIRATKSDWEVEQIRGAAAQYNRLFDTALDWLKEPISGLELTARVEGRLRSLGHGGTIRLRRRTADIAVANVVSGDVALYPTNFNGCVGGEGPYPPSPATGGWETLTPGNTVMFDIVTSYNGYQADTTRSFYLGDSIPARVAAAHDFCVDVLREIEQRMKPGAVCSEIYREVRSLIEARGEPEGFMGFGDNRVKFYGHGVGLDLDEMPVIADRIDVSLKPGMILAVEPKAFLPGRGPVGVENTYVITADGCESFCPLELSLKAVS